MKRYPISVTLPVLWGDMDALGHVNNTRYFRWFESARIAYFSAIGLGAKGSALAVGPILATTTCDYLKPVTYPDEVVVGARVESIGNSSFTMRYGVARVADSEVLVARGSGVIVLVDYRKGTKVRVPPELREAIAGIEG